MRFIAQVRYLSVRSRNSAGKWLPVLFFSILTGMLWIVSPLSAVILTVAGVAALTLLVKPEYSLYAMVLLLIPGSIIAFTVSGVTLHLYHLFAFVVLLSWVIARLTDTLPPAHGTGCDQPLLILWAWALLSLLWSHNRVVGLEDTLKLSVAISFLFLITFYVTSSRTLNIVLKLFILTALIDGIISVIYPYSSFYKIHRWTLFESLEIVFKFWIKHKTRGFSGRGMGFWPAHGTAVMLSFAITFCMMLFIVNKNAKRRIILMGLAVFLFAAAIGTLTKSIAISLLISAAYVVFHLKPFPL